MDYSKIVGRVHLGFFDHSHLFKRTRVTKNGKGEVGILSPFFALRYDFNSGTLYCKDEDVLNDFADLIAANYGAATTREEFLDSLHWNREDDKHSVLNVGVCMLADSIVGWDGRINAVWYDADPPGEIVKLHFQYWTRRMLNGAYKLDMGDVVNLGGSNVVLPNLLDAVKYIDKKNLSKVSALLKEIN